MASRFRLVNCLISPPPFLGRNYFCLGIVSYYKLKGLFMTYLPSWLLWLWHLVRWWWWWWWWLWWWWWGWRWRWRWGIRWWVWWLRLYIYLYTHSMYHFEHAASAEASTTTPAVVGSAATASRQASLWLCVCHVVTYTKYTKICMYIHIHNTHTYI